MSSVPKKAHKLDLSLDILCNLRPGDAHASVNSVIIDLFLRWLVVFS